MRRRSEISKRGSPKNSFAAAVLELDERAQQHADRLTRDAADARQVGLARIRVQVREEGTQVSQIDQDEPTLVGEPEEQ